MADPQNPVQGENQNNANADPQTNPILLAHDKNRPMREYASLNLYDFCQESYAPPLRETKDLR